MKIYIIKKLLRLLDDKEKHEILTEAVTELYNTISDNDIFKQVGDKWTYLGKEMNDGQKRQLIIEAKQLKLMRVWNLLQREIKYLSNKKMFEKSLTEHDLIAGKLWLFTLDCFESKINQIIKADKEIIKDLPES